MRHIVICVHGTFAAAPGDDGDAWWQRSGAIAKALIRNRVLAKHFQCAEKCFHWSGLNSLSARESAAESLLEFIQAFEQSKTPYHLLGHSHGGSVIWAMLRRVAATPDVDLKYLESWLSVGTPFVALKQTLLGKVLERVLGWITVTLLSIFLAGIVLSLIHAYFSAEVLGFYPSASPMTFFIGSLIMLPLWLYSYSIARDHKPDPGSVIVNTERKDLLEKFVSKWFGIWSVNDEAIAALRTSLSDKISPLARRPWKIELSFRRNPMFIRSILSLPSRLLWNWLLQPISNHILRGTLRASSLGIDRPGISATGIEPWPRIFGNQTEFPALPHIIDDELRKRADVALSKSAPTLRSMLTDVSVGIDANAALSPETVSLFPSALVHTSYFENRLVLELIFRWLLLQKKVTQLDSQKTMARNYISTFLQERRRLERTLLDQE